MKHFIIIAFMAVSMATPGLAEDRDDSFDQGLRLFEEGTRLLLEGLLEELAPALEELESLLLDLNAYHAPEILPNGDIIIRRKVPLTPEQAQELEL